EHDDAVEREGRQERAHAVHDGAAYDLLLATTDERHRPDGCGLRRTQQLESDVAIRAQRDELVGVVDLVISRHDPERIPRIAQKPRDAPAIRVKTSRFLTPSRDPATS